MISRGTQNIFLSILLCVLFFQYIIADVYLHIPRGSNNRLLGENANRQNAKRVFNSQNNAKGGYNAPEKTQNKSSSDWFHMNYYMSGSGEGKTILPIEWTNQHGCGHDDLNCNIVIQYMCQATTVTEKHRVMRNGNSERTPLFKKRSYPFYPKKAAKVKADAGKDRAINEPWEWYDKCTKRERNKGLFTADQQLKGNSSIYTRQNSQGTRYGYECPEERDYYPYWHPNVWTDIVVLANEKEDCSYYKNESFNTQPKGECLEQYKKSKRNPETIWRHFSTHNNEADCVAKGKKWIIFHNYLEIVRGKTKDTCKGDKLFWAIPHRFEYIDQLKGEDPEQWKECLVKLPEPDCQEAPKTRPNHLGNGEGIVPLTYSWVLPHFPSGQEQRCVLRIRYNISTNDYDPKNTFASSNNNDDVITNDPDVEVGKGSDNKVPLQLAINTAQFGRTFQDRSHVFKIIPRKESFKDCVIHNLNVKGKRGNIVQVYPAVEYDFTPKNLEIKSSHCVHIQFGGSNRNPKRNDGEGRKQTDRSNLVAMKLPDVSYPLENTTGTLFDGATVIDAPNILDFNETKSGADIAIAMATAGYFKRAQDVPSPFEVQGCDVQQAEQLNCYPPSYTGLLLRLKPGQYYYMCSRNNNFTNRNQKAGIKVT